MIENPPFLTKLAEQFRSQGFQLFLVGGAVRDQILRRDFNEWDLATDAKPSDIEGIFRVLKLKAVNTIGKRFGTITGKIDEELVEITTFRSDAYQEYSRKPTVIFGKTLREDLSRRDFTINAIAFDILTEKIIDPFDGQVDLGLKVIRSVGKARERFSEDPLRMLRAIRLAVVLDFEIEPDTLSAITVEKSRLGIVSSERVALEMDKMLLSDKPSQGIQYLVETGLISYILPELLPSINLEFDPKEHKDIYQHILKVLDNTPPKLELRWCALLHDIAKPLTRTKVKGEYHFLGHENVSAKMAREILTRLKYSGEFMKYLIKLVRQHQRIPAYDGSWADGGVRRFVRDAGETLDDLFTFAEADATGGNERKLAQYRAHRADLKERIKKLEKEAEIAKIKSPLSGDELMKIFKKEPGPWIKPIKEKLLGMVLDGELKETDKEKAELIARHLVEEDRIRPE